MKKILYITAGLLFCALSSTSSVYAAVKNGTPGGVLNIPVTPAGVPGAQPIAFTPSTNVNMGADVVSTSFAINAWHDQADQKKNGQAYGMAADSNKMFFLDISGTAATAVSGTNAGAAFAGWNTM